MEKPEGIKVVDRRRFDESGEKTGEAAPSGASAKQEPEKSSSPRDQLPPVDFSSFIVGLATQALVYLGEIPDPQSGEKTVNFDAAKNYIDVVAMLQEKTKGNLSESERKLVEEVLTSVRLAYVHRVKSGG